MSAWLRTLCNLEGSETKSAAHRTAPITHSFSKFKTLRSLSRPFALRFLNILNSFHLLKMSEEDK